mmetsp:Transcript_45780/g.89456  ORF Transcript_45780/g.89456 Transcript_45780/m.89456 type:complete len:866 (-) Transcript_45780:186-2783(-)|eukprot:CAMPEP_0194342702 /NCGR_PEP_ID=MMETSP0171-20130528/93788_1 /TAXON_ID=218684 /ORGANISM="Corethron pennatum, Strain L29A3" /LENGTH=865 /DNA_ID=CAMNT_0039108569 /DNA_START=34 /DNA_END=2631 /DNA_ORIENTATION=-
MKLSPRESDHLSLSHAGALAQRRLARGCLLSHPEASALICYYVMERARDGEFGVADLMDRARSLLGRAHVMAGVPHLLRSVQVEATFPDGTKLVTVHDPLAGDDGDLAEALYGSFLPVPPPDAFRRRAGKMEVDGTPADDSDAVAPGHVWTPPGGAVTLNAGREAVLLSVFNATDRPIQVGSHYHFFECNSLLAFDRRIAYGRRLNICSGTAVRFEPGEQKTVPLVPIAGHRVVRGGNGLIDGPVEQVGSPPPDLMAKIAALGFRHVEEPSVRAAPAATLPREAYARIFGPTVGDRVRLGDTALVVEVERDLVAGASASGIGDELKFGGGKVIRDGMGQAAGRTAAEVLDTVITNALVLDYTGIYKADIGIKHGNIAGIGKAGNPDTMDGVAPELIVGANTEAIAGEGLILTAGGVDAHVHFICPQLADEAVASGLTTMLGGGTGPASGTCATTCTPAPCHLRMMMRATDGLPLNFGFTGKGNSSRPEGLLDAVTAGACGLKLHEDWGTTPATIDCCLRVAEDHDIQVTIHTDTLNESTCCEGSLAAFKGRTVHTYHSEGAGGGHAPDIITVCGALNVLPSSTNPTRPFTKNTIDEHLDMLMVCHHLDKSSKEDVAFAESRIRGETIAAEDILQDMGAISIISSDSQAMGRVGEVITRTWQTAHKMKVQRGPLPEDADAARTPAVRGPLAAVDNLRARRYVAKYTINPAVAHGFSDLVGSVEAGKLADLVLWRPAFFGAKPELVLKGGQIAWAQMGDPNASIPTPEPVGMRPMFAGRSAAAAADCSVVFVSRAGVETGTVAGYGLGKRVYAVRNCRGLTKKDMRLNDAMPEIKVNPETYRVTADGVELKCLPVDKLPLAQQYFFS